MCTAQNVPDEVKSLNAAATNRISLKDVNENQLEDLRENEQVFIAPLYVGILTKTLDYL